MVTQDQTQPHASETGMFMNRDRSNWVRLRTLMLLRWIAIIGQLAALIVAQKVYGLQINAGLCYLAVGVSVMGNLIAMLVFPGNTRLTEIQNFTMVLFDLLQLAFLLFLTGGLHNPFSLLMLGPVTISAAVLTLRLFILLASASVLLQTLLVTYHLPLRTASGQVLEIPDIFLFGHWLATVIAVLFFGIYSRRVVSELHGMSDALTATQMALAREQKLTDLGGVVAAAAHEMGTPLATIKLTSAELMEELGDQPELYEDAALIREQADRCRDILRDMGRAGKDDLHLRKAPLSALVEEAAEPHEGRGIDISYLYEADADSNPAQPSVLRKPEIIHGLRNLVQNAVDFSHDHVWIEAEWSDTQIRIRIADDGPGFPSQVIGRIGDPFMRQGRKSAGPHSGQRQEYEGMGLGLFIAKTLLERTGAELTFANGREGMLPSVEAGEFGAIVEVSWPRELIDAKYGINSLEIGENIRIRG